MDTIEQTLLNTLQAKFPIVSRPFAEIGQQVGVSESEAIERLERMKANGSIRYIGPLFDAVKLNYKTTLVAIRTAENVLDNVTERLGDFPVSHAYERNNHFNLWCTLAFPANSDVNSELRKIASAVNAESCFSLPAVKLFKLRTYFHSGDGKPAEIPAEEDVHSDSDVSLSELDRKVINEIQSDLPLNPAPFSEMAAKIGVGESDFVSCCDNLLARGIMRRFSISVNHRKVGYSANGMACWAVPSSRVDEVGEKLASLKEVSHCYERQTNPLWQYNIFAMIHSQKQDECRRIAESAADELGLTEGIILFSTREFKKARLHYKV